MRSQMNFVIIMISKNIKTLINIKNFELTHETTFCVDTASLELIFIIRYVNKTKVFAYNHLFRSV